MQNNLILDAACGSRMFWYEKDNPNVPFMEEVEDDEWQRLNARRNNNGFGRDV